MAYENSNEAANYLNKKMIGYADFDRLIDMMAELHEQGRPVSVLVDMLYKRTAFYESSSKEYPQHSQDPWVWQDWWTANKHRYYSEEKPSG